MQLVDFDASRAVPISEYDSRGASVVSLASGMGESHAYAVHIEPGGKIGPHDAGFGQLFLCVAGEGWVSGADDVRHRISAGRGAVIEIGERHAKGSDHGMTAIMVQMAVMTPPPSRAR